MAIEWLKDCEICNTGLCNRMCELTAAVDDGGQGVSERKASRIMEAEAAEAIGEKVWTAGQIHNRYRYHTGKKVCQIDTDKKATKKKPAGDPEQMDLFDSESSENTHVDSEVLVPEVIKEAPKKKPVVEEPTGVYVDLEAQLRDLSSQCESLSRTINGTFAVMNDLGVRNVGGEEGMILQFKMSDVIDNLTTLSETLEYNLVKRDQDTPALPEPEAGKTINDMVPVPKKLLEEINIEFFTVLQERLPSFIRESVGKIKDKLVPYIIDPDPEESTQELPEPEIEFHISPANGIEQGTTTLDCLKKSSAEFEEHLRRFINRVDPDAWPNIKEHLQDYIGVLEAHLNRKTPKAARSFGDTIFMKKFDKLQSSLGLLCSCKGDPEKTPRKIVSKLAQIIEEGPN